MSDLGPIRTARHRRSIGLVRNRFGAERTGAGASRADPRGTGTARPRLHSRAWLVAAAVVVALTLNAALINVHPPVPPLIALLLFAAACLGAVVWAFVRTRRQRRAFENELASWAADRAARDERLRLARELHDLASHGLGLITVRAAAARRLPGPDGDVERR